MKLSHTIAYIKFRHEMSMKYDAAALGSAFSEWSQLTEEYRQGMEALRRREPGASCRMMEIAQRLNAFHRVGCPDSTAEVAAPQDKPALAFVSGAGKWLAITAGALFSARNQGLATSAKSFSPMQ